MKTFKSFLKEEVDQFSTMTSGDLDTTDPAMMRSINTQLARVSNDVYVTPHLGLLKVRQCLSYYNIALPRFNFGNTDEGETAFEVPPFGGITGKQMNGVVTPPQGDETRDTPYVYFAWNVNDAGMFQVDAEIMPEWAIEELLGSDDDDAEDYGEDDYEYNTSYGMDEAVEVSHARYMRSHGKKARDAHGGGSSSWMFTHKDMGEVDVKDTYTAQGKLADAKKRAQSWAKQNGHSTVYIMEGMPSSVIKHKQKISNSSDDENKKRFAGKSQQTIAGMARRHGYGTKNPYAKHHDGVTESKNKGNPKHDADWEGGVDAERIEAGKGNKYGKAKKGVKEGLVPNRNTKITGDANVPNKGGVDPTPKSKRKAVEVVGKIPSKAKPRTYASGMASMREGFKPLSAQNDETRARISSRLAKDDDSEGSSHIVMQLRKVVSLRGDKPVKFADGKSVKVDQATARKFLNRYSKLQKPMDKEKLQSKAGASYDALKKCVNEENVNESSKTKHKLGSKVKVNGKQGKIIAFKNNNLIVKFENGDQKQVFKTQLDESSKTKKATFLKSVGDVEKQSKAAGNFYWNSSHHPKDVDNARKKHGKRMDLAKKVYKRYKTQNEENVNEISRNLATRYISSAEAKGDRKNGELVGKRAEGRKLALKKKWGDKKYGFPEPKVKATNEENVNELSKDTLKNYISKAASKQGKLIQKKDSSGKVSSLTRNMDKAGKKINELSKPVLRNYVKKAENSADSHEKQSARTFNLKKARDHGKKADRRYKGLSMADKKLKEDEQIGEANSRVSRHKPPKGYKSMSDWHKKAREKAGLPGDYKKWTNQPAKKPVKEEEQIDELSKNTLKSYIKSASKSANRLQKPQPGYNRKYDNRLQGMYKADKKLKEDEQIDEISMKTIHSFNKKTNAKLGQAHTARMMDPKNIKKHTSDVKNLERKSRMGYKAWTKKKASEKDS